MYKNTYRVVLHVDHGADAWEAEFYVWTSDAERAVKMAYSDAQNMYPDRVDPYPVLMEELS